MTSHRFRMWRKRLGVTQRAAASLLALTERAIQHYESGTRAISPPIEKLAKEVERQFRRRKHKSKGTHNSYDPRDVVATPQAFFDRLDAEFHFDIDVCALPDNAKCKRYFTPKMNGLARPWRGLTCFVNPPYYQGRIREWIRKAYEESQRGAVVVCLIHVVSDADWWSQFVLKAAEIRFVRGRLNGFGRSAVVVFRRRTRPTKVRTMLANPKPRKQSTAVCTTAPNK